VKALMAVFGLATLVSVAAAQYDEGEFLVDTCGVHQEEQPAIATDGTNYLVTWTDRRDSIGGPDVFFMRVSQNGGLLDPVATPISSLTYAQQNPAVVFDGSNWFVVREDYRAGSWLIYGARVSQDGLVLDPNGILVSTMARDHSDPAVAFDGTNYLVVWSEFDGYSSDLYGARVSRNGAVLDPGGFVISSANRDQNSPVVASDGSGYWVVWEDGRASGRENLYDIYGARVTAEGEVLNPDGVPVSVADLWQVNPAVAYDGMNYLVAWSDEREYGNWNLYCSRVTPDGLVLDFAGIPVCRAPNAQFSPEVSASDTGFLVYWEDWRSGDNPHIYRARVSSDGVVTDSAVVVCQDGGQRYPATSMSSEGRRLLVYQGWAGVVAGKTYDADRIWGRLEDGAGIALAPEISSAIAPVASTIVRGVLYLPPSPSPLPTGEGSGVREASLLDAAGRNVLSLRPGFNDVSRLSPGVYFLRSEPSAASRGPAAITKVIVTR
jgi:hypothetical protein